MSESAQENHSRQNALLRVLKGVPGDFEYWMRDVEWRFDLVLFGDVLEHLFDPVAAMREALGVLHQGGRVVVAVPNSGYWSKRMRFLWQGALTHNLLEEHIRFFNRRILKDAFDLAGFRLGRVVPYCWGRGRSWYSKSRWPDWSTWGFVDWVLQFSRGS